MRTQHEEGKCVIAPPSRLAFYRFSGACKSRNLTTRQEQAGAFKFAYIMLLVGITALRGLGNFETFLQGSSSRIRRISGVVYPRSFQLLERRTHEVNACMKEYLHCVFQWSPRFVTSRTYPLNLEVPCRHVPHGERIICDGNPSQLMVRGSSMMVTPHNSVSCSHGPFPP